MTLTKVPMAKGSPFLIADETRNGRLTIVGEPRQIDTKFKNGQWVMDVEIKKSLSSDEYNKFGIKDIEERMKHNTRSYFINGTSFNYLIDELGDDEKTWNGKEIDVQPVMQMINGERKEVLYVEGSV